MPGDQVTVEGRVEAVFFAGPRFSAGRLETKDGTRVSFAGRLFVRENDLVRLEGSWETHPKYGRQLQVQSMEYDLDPGSEGLARYLANNPDIKGIGPAKAAVIAETFGERFDWSLENEPEAVAAVAKVPLETITRLRDLWMATRSSNQASAALSAYGLTHHQVSALVKRFGSSAVGLVQADPYLIVGALPGFGFKRIDKIARAVGTPKDLPGRLRAGILHSVDEALDAGHTWTEHEELIDQANRLLVLDELDSRERIEQTLDGLIDEGKLSCASQGGRFLVAMPAIRRQEEELARQFARAAEPNPSFGEKSETALTALVAEVAPQLNAGQRKAVLTSLRSSISVISGGAGAGKTFTVAALADVYEKHQLQVVLAAPTGKAAKRLEQVVFRQASTIHRLLGFNGHEFARPAEEPIDADLLVVDECSMCDLPLAWQLFRAIDFERTAVVLVGDHNQLPPVGPGNLLRDLIESKTVPTVVLDEIVRQAGVLKENSTAILRGEVRRTSAGAMWERRPWYVADRFSDQTEAQGCILDLLGRILPDKLGFDPVADVQVLTPTHHGPLGTVALNIAIQRLLQKKLWGVEAPETPAGRRPRFLLHDKVIQTRNDYELGVMNGTVGRVVGLDRDGSMEVDFEGNVVEIPSAADRLRNLQLAYAMTIHRAQGSEFPVAIVVVHKAHSFMHHRNLLYTGVTRAKTTAIVVGDQWGIRNCVARQEVGDRRTFLSFLLHDAANDAPIAAEK